MIRHLETYGRWGAAASRAMSLLLFATALGALLLIVLADIPPGQALAWALGALGPGFVVLLLALTLVALMALVRVHDAPSVEDLLLWRDAGLHAASAIATMALTWTLLGISLGIGTLAETDLSPDTVQAVIAELTQHFSMAFLTTVIGLPVATLLRALIGVAAANRRRTLTKPGITIAEYGPPPHHAPVVGQAPLAARAPVARHDPTAPHAPLARDSKIQEG